jgi:CheY-like chemotaxis protein
MHILLIDDSSSTRSLLRTLINSGQTVRHDISEAASGEEALQKVGSGEINLPDLIIMDINMGGMSGYELCREFRQRHGNGSGSEVFPYIIIVTANEGVDVINQALDSGANDYMSKPVNVKVLHVRLRVAERLLALAQAGIGPSAGLGALKPESAPLPPPPATAPALPANGADHSRDLQIGAAIEHADAPVALVEVGAGDTSFKIVYANSSMTLTTQFDQDQLIGKSLADLEAWTPEFLKMALSYINRGAILSYVPLWSRTRQSVPVHLSFYPIRTEDDTARNYLVIHHF